MTNNEAAPGFQNSTERRALGKACREQTPRADHAAWQPAANRRDPIEILEESNQGRVPDLVPIRYGRMLANPFAFLRGSAALMAYDLASTPSTGIRVQACGDCHVANFGLFATPERNLVFDLNDFDQALGKFALAYADQAEQDHAALIKAVKSGRLTASLES